jgi:ABC-type transport system involved in multi-copper enzyme maturation permease subunit
MDDAVASRRSSFRALVWKEWRQQRWIFLLLAGFPHALLAAVGLILLYEHRNFRPGGPGFFGITDAAGGVGAVLTIIALFVGAVSVAIYSANAFAGEREDNSDQFLAAIPCSRNKLFWIKLGSTLSLVALECVPLIAVCAVVFTVLFWNKPASPARVDILRDVASLLKVAGTGMLTLAIVPAFVSSLGGSVIGTIIGCAPALTLCWAYVWYSPRIMALFLPVGSSNDDFVATMWLFGALMIATVLFAAWRMWVRRAPARAWRTTAATIGFLIACFAVPSVATYSYATFFAPLKFFVNHGDSFASAQVRKISPDGKYVTFAARYQGWSFEGERVAVVAIQTGEARWLTRLHRSSFCDCFSRESWCPATDEMAIYKGDQWLWPWAARVHEFGHPFLVDPRSGRELDCEKVWPGIYAERQHFPAPLGWCENLLVLYNEHGEHYFLNAESGKSTECDTPAVAFGKGAHFFFPYMSMTSQGCFAISQGNLPKGQAALLRYDPNLPEAECIIIKGIAETWQRVIASDDGQWLVVAAWDVQGRAPAKWYLVRWEQGAKPEPLAFMDAGEFQKAPPRFQNVSGFLPGSHQILLEGGGIIGLFDPDTHKLREIPYHLGNGVTKITRYSLSPSGGFLLIGTGTSAVDSAGAYVEKAGWIIVDLHAGTSESFQSPAQIRVSETEWLGEDHLLLMQGKKTPWVTNREGTGARPLLAN